MANSRWELKKPEPNRCRNCGDLDLGKRFDMCQLCFVDPDRVHALIAVESLPTACAQLIGQTRQIVDTGVIYRCDGQAWVELKKDMPYPWKSGDRLVSVIDPSSGYDLIFDRWLSPTDHDDIFKAQGDDHNRWKASAFRLRTQDDDKLDVPWIVKVTHYDPAHPSIEAQLLEANLTIGRLRARVQELEALHGSDYCPTVPRDF